MKNLAILLALACAPVTEAFAQTEKRSDLKGPAYKNYKPKKSDDKSTVLYSESKRNDLKGPAYKNQKQGDSTTAKTLTPVTIGTERSKLKGPAYKNYKPKTKE